MRDLVRDLARRGLRRVLWKEGGLGEAVEGGARDCIFDGFGGKKRRCFVDLVWWFRMMGILYEMERVVEGLGMGKELMG